MGSFCLVQSALCSLIITSIRNRFTPFLFFWGVSLPGHAEELGQREMEKLRARLDFSLAGCQDVQMLEVSGIAPRRIRFKSLYLLQFHTTILIQLFPQLAVSLLRKLRLSHYDTLLVNIGNSGPDVFLRYIKKSRRGRCWGGESLALQNDSNRMEQQARTKNSKLIQRKDDEVIR